LKITDVVCHVLVDPDYDVTATSSSQDDLVVEILTDEGLSGIGESDLNRSRKLVSGTSDVVTADTPCPAVDWHGTVGGLPGISGWPGRAGTAGPATS